MAIITALVAVIRSLFTDYFEQVLAFFFSYFLCCVDFLRSGTRQSRVRLRRIETYHNFGHTRSPRSSDI